MYVYENIRMSMYEEHLCSYSSIESVRVMRNVMNERINMIMYSIVNKVKH